MKKKQFLVACMPAFITLLIIVMNVLAENKVTALYRDADAALKAQDYSAVQTYLSQIREIAPEYVPQYELSAERYLQMNENNQQLAYQELSIGIRNTGSKYLISLANRLARGDADLIEADAETNLPQTLPEEEWSADLPQATTSQPSGTDVQYVTMNYDFIVRYPDSRMENDVQLEAPGSAGNWTWASSNPAIASVDANGLVHCGNQEGEAKITATSPSNEVAECWVCIIEPGIYSNDGLGAEQYGYSRSEYYYIPEGNLSLDVGYQGMDAALASTKTGSVMEILPRNAVSGDGLVGTSELAYTVSNGSLEADMVDENGFPVYNDTSSGNATAESAQQPSTAEGGYISLELGWQSLYFSGEYCIPENLRFNGVEFTITSVNFSNVYSSNITSINLPATVTDIHAEYGNPFSNYTELESITVEAGNSAYKTVDGALLTADGTELIAYPIASQATEFTIPDGVTTIAPQAFANNRNLTTLHIPSSLIEIGQGALSNVSSLNNITLDSGNTAFQMVDGVLMDAAGTKILAAAVDAMPENYTISAQVTSVNTDIFRQNSKVKQLTVDASLNSLNLNDFTGLETLVINGSLDYLSYSASESKLREVTINGEVQNASFYGGSENMVITLNASVQSLSASGDSTKLVNSENVTRSLLICPDGNLETALSPTLQDLTLELDGQALEDLQALRSCASLTSLTVRNGTVGDLSALSALPLQRLELSTVDVSDLTPIWQCAQLTSLSIEDTEKLTSVEGIQTLQELTTVDFSRTQLENVTPLAACTKLEYITLSGCANVHDLSPLLDLPSLVNLTLFNTEIPEQTLQAFQERGVNIY